MRGAIKHIVLLLVAAVVILFLAIPVLRRMEPHHDLAPAPVHDSAAAPIARAEKPDSTRVRDVQETPREPRRIGEWRELKSWNGTGATTTEPVTIQTRTWRVVWETEISSTLGAEMFQVRVYDERGSLKSVAAFTNKTDRGETILPGPGTFTLNINTAQKWTVKVEEKG